MLTLWQRHTLFGLFCLAIVVFCSLEAYLLWAIVHSGIDPGNGIGALFNTGVLAGCGALFLKLLEANFLRREILPMSRLHSLASERNSILDTASRSGQRIFETRQSTVTSTLRFAEETLRGWIPGSHFELCVFVDVEEPFLFGYFDSNKDITARSMAERLRNRSFYVDKGYEVTKLLRHPTSQAKILPDTSDARFKYVFTTTEQQRQLRSTFLLCLDLTTPCALVASSNEHNAFAETDEKLMSFLKYVGQLVRYDLFDEGFIHRIRHQKPELFSPVPAVGVGATSPSKFS